MDCSPSLSRLQQDLLREFFARERRFVLTGGGALLGYHLHHRTSDDLDFDLRAILARGIDLRSALVDAERKDGGVSPATLAWILDQVVIGADAKLPGVTGHELDVFRHDLVKQLRAIARPDEP